MSDAAWLARHNDYVRAGILDIWFWHESLGPQRIVLEHGQIPWSAYAQSSGPQLGAPVAHRHTPDDVSCWRRPETLTVHFPPCSTDDISFYVAELSAYTLTSLGIELPARVKIDLRRARATVIEERAAIARLRSRRSSIERRFHAPSVPSAEWRAFPKHADAVNVPL
jgi:hypothetical protein